MEAVMIHTERTHRPAALAGALALLALAASSWATPTDPTLAPSSVVSDAGAGARSLRLDGIFPAEDLAQLAYPMQVLIHTAAGEYVRYDLAALPVTGTAPGLNDGLDLAEALALLAQGVESPDARVVFLGRGRIEVVLPAAFPSGPVQAQLFVVDEGELIVSNAVAVVLEATP
jgi:hypothetical protein